MNGKELLRLLERNGWIVDRIRGSHHIMKHPDKKGVRIPVPVHSREVATGTAHSILKQAGLKKES